jgi:hypothetical protein
MILYMLETLGEKVREQGVNVLGKEDWVKETKEINKKNRTNENPI